MVQNNLVVLAFRPSKYAQRKYPLYIGHIERVGIGLAPKCGGSLRVVLLNKFYRMKVERDLQEEYRRFQKQLLKQFLKQRRHLSRVEVSN
jgi:hypothetical protein